MRSFIDCRPCFRPTSVTFSTESAAGSRRSGKLETHAEGAPVAAADEDRRRQVLHEDEIAAAHVAPVGLQQERFCIGGDLLDVAVGEQPAVAAMGVIPDWIGAWLVAVFRIM